MDNRQVTKTNSSKEQPQAAITDYAKSNAKLREEIERLRGERDQVIDGIVDLINAEADVFLSDPHCTGEMRFTGLTMKAVALRICALKK